MEINNMNENTLDLVDLSVIKKDIMPTMTVGQQLVSIDYGNIPRKSKSNYFVQVTEKEGVKIDNLKADTSCGCTTTVVEKVDNYYLVEIKYSTNIARRINKAVTLSFFHNKEKKKIFLKLIGKVV